MDLGIQTIPVNSIAMCPSRMANYPSVPRVVLVLTTKSLTLPETTWSGANQDGWSPYHYYTSFAIKENFLPIFAEFHDNY